MTPVKATSRATKADKPPAKSKAAAKSQDPAHEPAPPATGNGCKRKRSNKDSAASEAPPRKSARTAAPEAQPALQPEPDAAGDSSGAALHPWSKEGMKNLSAEGVTLSPSIVKRLTANTTPLTAKNGGTIKRCSFWPKGFEFPEGLDDEKHVIWVVLSRAFEGEELSDHERKIVRYAYKVWPQDVHKSQEMQQMFLKVLVG
ncbi:hypothetical protein AURDEDRAFT_124893 [Auricularia subglabra TFB-10046 SS5]|nr:hypothetical protein AURDEDRAFT_124893 [Auricularia subglabra TFB-10046 SS5]